VKLKVGDVSLKKDGIEKSGAHDEILQARSVAYSSRSGNFVNGCDQVTGKVRYPPETKNVDIKQDRRKRRLGKVFRQLLVVEKLRKGVDNEDLILPLEFGWPAASRVEDTKYFYCILANAIRNYVGCAGYDQFTCARNPARAAQSRMPAQLPHRLCDR
jgi:hypothetical protein